MALWPLELRRSCWPIFFNAAWSERILKYLYIYIISWHIYTIYTIANVRRLYDHHGWIMVVYFWGSWCLLCDFDAANMVTTFLHRSRPPCEARDGQGWRDGELTMHVYGYNMINYVYNMYMICAWYVCDIYIYVYDMYTMTHRCQCIAYIDSMCHFLATDR